MADLSTEYLEFLYELQGTPLKNVIYQHQAFWMRNAGSFLASPWAYPIRNESDASFGEMLMIQLVHNHPRLEGAFGGDLYRELQDA